MYFPCRRRKLVLSGAVLAVMLVSAYWSYTIVSLRFVKKHVKTESRSSGNLVQSKSSHRDISSTMPVVYGGRGGEIFTETFPATSEPREERRATTNTGLLGYLSKLEHMIYITKERPKVLIKSTSQSAQKRIVLYKTYLEDIDAAVISDNGTLSDHSRWSTLLCFIPEDNVSCLAKDAFALLKDYQKVSYIPGMDKVMLRNDGFCYSMTATRQISSLAQEPLSPPCYVLPVQQKNLKEIDSNAKQASWIRKSFGFSKHDWSITATFEDVRNLDGNHVVHALPVDPLTLADKTAVMQLYVLVMSVIPLRLYRHQEGEAFLHPVSKTKREVWTLQQLNEDLVRRFGDKTAKRALRNLDAVIVKTLLTVESSLLSNFESLGSMYKCEQCFQLLVFSCMFNSSLHPVVVEVKDSAQSDIPSKVVQDTVHALLTQHTSQSVLNTLDTFKDTIGTKKFGCNSAHKACLDDSHLKYLIRQDNEAQQLGAFNKIYPTADGERYNRLLIELKSLYGGVIVGRNKDSGHTTPDVHNMLTALERFRLVKGSKENVTNTEKFWAGTSVEDKNTKSGRGVEKDDPKCSKDAETELIELHVEPAVKLAPVFSSTIHSYQATVTFETMVIKLWGRTSTCTSEARINSLTGPSKPTNVSVGVGWNQFQVLVVDLSRTPEQVVQFYKVSVFRQRRSENEKPFVENVLHQVCSQVQDCDLKVYSSKSCGLQRVKVNSWKDFIEERLNLPTCKNGHEKGRWFLPCGSCSDSHSCFWREAVWAPLFCRYRFLTRNELQACMVKRKVLFVGDSTNRGMMYYLMEKLNGSLKTWEKTHSMKVYSNQLTATGTSVSYAYYPQYWLPNNQKPGFVKALYQLIARFLPLDNSNRTVLVVGGVQWLASEHIRDMQIALKSLGLDNIKVIVKTSGSGFHLPLPGIKHNNLAAQQKEAARNDQLINTVKAYGYGAVDTFSITVSRYKEFLSGSCGCHFHKVVDRKSNLKEDDEVASQRNGTYSSLGPLSRYHVIGPINRVYSEILFGRLCG